MTLYQNQISTCINFEQFLEKMNENLAYNAMIALKLYVGILPTDYENYVVFFVDYDKKGNEIFAITKIIDEWQPIEVNDRVRKFTKNYVFDEDSFAHISFE